MIFLTIIIFFLLFAFITLKHQRGIQCSAYTHVLADTIRSVAVMLAAIIAMLSPEITPQEADASAAIVVSVIIMIALLPLLSGLKDTGFELYAIRREEMSEKYALANSSSSNAFNDSSTVMMV